MTTKEFLSLTGEVREDITISLGDCSAGEFRQLVESEKKWNQPKVFYIPYNTPSSKNSKQWTGRVLIDSKTVKKYKENTEPYWLLQKKDFLQEVKGKIFPLRVHFRFVRGSRRKFDYINPTQTVQDLMVKYRWIPDDSMQYIIPVFDEYVYEKNKGGVYIWVE